MYINNTFGVKFKKETILLYFEKKYILNQKYTRD